MNHTINSSSNIIGDTIMNKKRYNITPSIKYNDSSSESSIINFETIEFEPMEQNNKKSILYNITMIDSMSFHNIYDILVSTSYLIFIDNNKIDKKSKSFFKYFGKKNTNLNESQFQDCIFLPYERVDIIKKNIHILNNNIQKAEYENLQVYKNEEVCIGILFDEGIINKNCLYKRMDIIDTIMFIPIEKYNIKQIEYKIRGFCQIVEELGAKSINIIFKKNSTTSSNKHYELSINNDIRMIAGNLGFTSSCDNINEEMNSYNISFPLNNTIILNENTIKTKIKNKKLIISEVSYNSNLELQYLVNSRCKHMIHKYSTIFTFNNNNIKEHSMYANLKNYGIDIGFNISQLYLSYNMISIITNVVFSTMDDYTNIINGSNVSLDIIGFNFLIDSLKKATDFKTNGIYKIMVFINLYIEKHIKINMTKQYKTISLIMKKIKKELKIDEYAELLCNYFSINSQWIHFTNYIDILSNKTQTYDKLGYIIILCSDITISDKIDIMLKFIRNKCIEQNAEDNFWHMIQPYNIRLKNELKNKLLYEYDFIHYYNWYNLNMLLRCILLYTINFNNMDNNTHFLKLIQNMNYGYKYWEFYNNIVPFIINQAYTLHYTTKEELLFSNLLEKSLNIDSFISAKIECINDMNIYIEKKVSRIKNSYTWLTSMEYPMDLDKLCHIINNNTFIENYDYLNRKLCIIIKNKTREQLYELVETNDITYNVILNLINRLIIYNEKININKIPCNYIGFDIVYNNYMNGIKKIEFEKNVKPFIISHISEDTSIKDTSIKVILLKISFKTFNKYCTSYHNMIYYMKDILEENNIDTHIIMNMGA